MVKEDWRGVLVARKDSTCRVEADIYAREDHTSYIEGYGRIFKGLGIDNVVTVEEDEGSLDREEAKKVGEVVRLSAKKPLVIGFGHHLIADITDDSIDHVYFDTHTDDYDEKEFSCGSFINFMRGRHYCIGAREQDFCKRDGKKTILLRFDEPEKIVKQPFRNKIFLSYDTDVFHYSVTTAHCWIEAIDRRERLMRFSYEGKMFPEQIKDLSAEIVEGRDLVGIAVVQYSPCDKDYKTADIFVDLLKPLL